MAQWLRLTSPVKFHLGPAVATGDRKSTRLNSSHSQISYAVFCLKKKNGDPLSESIWVEPYHDQQVGLAYRLAGLERPYEAAGCVMSIVLAALPHALVTSHRHRGHRRHRGHKLLRRRPLVGGMCAFGLYVYHLQYSRPALLRRDNIYRSVI